MTLFWKLIVFTWSAMATVMHTSSYMACKSGKLHRLLLEISRKDGGLRNVRRRAIMMSVTGWVLIIANVGFGVYQYLFIPRMLDIFIAPITTWICPGNVSVQTNWLLHCIAMITSHKKPSRTNLATELTLVVWPLTPEPHKAQICNHQPSTNVHSQITTFIFKCSGADIIALMNKDSGVLYSVIVSYSHFRNYGTSS